MSITIYSDKPNMSDIYPDYHDLVYLLLGLTKYHQERLNLPINLSNRLRNILEELVSSYKAECILYDDLEGYSRLKTIFRHGVHTPVKDWENNYLISVFLDNFESIQDSHYLDNEVKYFLESLKQEIDKFFTAIEKTKYYTYGREYFG